MLFHQTAEEVLDEVLNASSSEDSDGDNVPLAASLKKKKVQVNSEVTVIPWIWWNIFASWSSCGPLGY